MSGWVIQFKATGTIMVSWDVRSALEYTVPAPIVHEHLPAAIPIQPAPTCTPTVNVRPAPLPEPLPAPPQALTPPIKQVKQLSQTKS
ncbi:hypothetical protein M231_04789 [Tremella mesenterica]|uniref:Uncharacterized protein n=1 Tax=Tremella mesenterica TaxID=5217 RepID=A0A4Q1BJV7_TREME|nr:hypothetical protein M231_04789 [Tremella mesenterica]